MVNNETTVGVKRLMKLSEKLREENLKLASENKKLAKENVKLRNENVVLSDANGDLTAANESLRDVVALQGERIKGEVAIGEFHKKSLESAESALVDKDARIVELCREIDRLLRVMKRLRRKLGEKRSVVGVLNREIEYQYKRREKAEKLLEAVDKALDVARGNTNAYGC